MQFTAGEVLTLLGVLGTVGAQAFALVRWTQGQIAAVRSEAAADIKALRAECQADIDKAMARVEQVRAECGRREDFTAIYAQLTAITGRLDSGFNTVHRRIDDLMRGGPGARGAD